MTRIPDTRIHYASAGAVRRPRSTPLAVSPVQAAHITLVAELASLKPNRIIGYAADRFDIMGRADHLKAVLAAVTAYTKVIVASEPQPREARRKDHRAAARKAKSRNKIKADRTPLTSPRTPSTMRAATS